MAEEPISAAAALIAVNEDERQLHHTETEVDVFARNIEDRVSNLMGGLSTWFNGMNMQTQNAMLSAQEHVQQNGGVMSTARAHLSNLESQLQLHSDRARSKSRSSAEPMPDDALFELDTKDEEEILEREKPTRSASVSSDAGNQSDAATSPPTSSWSHNSLWDVLRKVTAHPNVDRLQNTWKKNTTSDIPIQWQHTLKEAESLARAYARSSGAAMQNVSKDLQAKIQNVVKNLPTDENTPRTTDKSAMQPVHVVEDEEDFRWDDDDDDADNMPADERGMPSLQTSKPASERKETEATGPQSEPKESVKAKSDSPATGVTKISLSTNESRPSVDDDADSDWE